MQSQKKERARKRAGFPVGGCKPDYAESMYIRGCVRAVVTGAPLVETKKNGDLQGPDPSPHKRKKERDALQ